MNEKDLIGKTIEKIDLDGFGIKVTFTDGTILTYVSSDDGFSLWDIVGSEKNAPTIGGWISVEDRLPATETDVLAFLNDGIETRIAACNFARGVWYDCVMNCVVVVQHVTHWMPLPEPPSEI